MEASALTRMRAVGGSLVVTIPKEIVEAESLEEGEMVRIEVHKLKRDWFGCLKGIGPFTAEDETMAHD